MAKDLLLERSEILALFNEEELSRLIKEQIESDYTEICGTPVDYFKPLYYKYNALNDESVSMSADLREELNQKYMSISMLFIEQIQNVFQIGITEEWLENHQKDIPCMALALYTFFVLELPKNIEDALHGYIMKNADSLYKLFEDQKNKKDGSTAIYQKVLPIEKATLMANIYNVANFCINSMTEEEFLKSLEDGYVPGEIISKMLKSGDLTAEFMPVLQDIFTRSSYLRSMICFNIESSYRNMEPIKESKEKVKEPTESSKNVEE